MRETRFVLNSGDVFHIPADALASYRMTRAQSDYIEVTVRPLVERRNRNQNNLYQTLVKEMCQQSGNTPEDVKEMVKARAVYLGYPCEKDDTGLDSFVGEMPVPMSTAKVSIEEFEHLIEACYMVADDMGIYLRRR